MIELRLQGVQTLSVQLDRLQESVKNVFDPIEPFLDRAGPSVLASSLMLVVSR